VKNNLKIIPVSTVDEVLGHALTRKLTPIEWEEPIDPPAAAETGGEEPAVVTH